MISSHASLLKQLHEYVDEYIVYLNRGSMDQSTDANRDLRRVIRELEDLQKHPEQRTEVERLTQRIGDQLRHLQSLYEEPKPRKALSSQQKTLSDAFHDYFNQEIAYLASVGGSTRREQANLLLGEIIADLKALALHPDDDQALRLAGDLEDKRAQVIKLERPWQQMHEQSA